MFSQGVANVPCTLLHFVGGELIDVAKARIVQPGNRLFHGNPMPPNVYRVQPVRVLRGSDDMLPAFLPPGADEDDVMTRSACLSWPLLWPKSQIRLGAGGTTPQQDCQSCWCQAMARTPQCCRTCRTTLWHRIRTETTTTTVHLPKSISTLPNMGKLTSSAGLFLKNPTKTTVI